MNPMLEFRGVEKAFFGVRVLKNVSFSVPDGSMLGVVGENGAGKSTLMNILGGNLRADCGEIIFSGKPLAHADPREAERRGIAFIHQELNLFPNLTIAENLFLTRLPRSARLPWINKSELHARARELLLEVGLDVSPNAPLESLSSGERQLVEIAKALSFSARIIIFDEPTTSLTARETEHLFALIAKLRARGMTLIYISHALADIFRLCDNILVLRDGAVVAHGPKSDLDTERLIALMVGRTLDQVFPTRRQSPGNDSLLQVSGLSREGLLENISFDLHSGEILGFAGLMGAGRTEVARALFGLDPHDSGALRLSGDVLRHFSPRALMWRGLAFLTENRRSEGLCLDGQISENLLLAALPKLAVSPARRLSGTRLQPVVARLRALVHLDPKARDEQPVRTLSGGNQQKVVLGKWLLREPRILILDEPTRGIDVGAKSELYRLIHELADRGVAVLLISSEIEELMGLSDRILVLQRGRIVDELPRAEFDRERILRSALGSGEKVA